VVSVMVFNATFNSVSAMSWRSVLLVEEAEVPGENHRLAGGHWQTLSNIVELRSLALIGTDCNWSCKSNYHTIKTTLVFDSVMYSSRLLYWTDYHTIKTTLVFDSGMYSSRLLYWTDYHTIKTTLVFDSGMYSSRWLYWTDSFIIPI
jgi:hypothetical protein